ncbi:MAG: hypothetical protein BJ554DRAFT_4656 [Olpidium bornovanus]|uniref:Exosome complex component CSL4 C-terminal domain-containing protein n=1 Tax=Olpidium bornovanus TaxID=278681 RepID=A0A8H7ZZT7_9FUNG|nr:MAG: hypothetical protein BJ554DRAFT_4656 [Olpidium bornovanus]
MIDACFRLHRTQDVRAVEKDDVQIYKCFRPGDVVRAQVVGCCRAAAPMHFLKTTDNLSAAAARGRRPSQISLGDARSYQLSTAHNDLGVIFAKSVAVRSFLVFFLDPGNADGLFPRLCRAGAMMGPISWREMMCTKTKAIEFRKCAKPATSADPTPQEKDA